MMAALQGIRINSDAIIRREAISENHDCVIVDDFLQDPNALVEFAADHADKFSRPDPRFAMSSIPHHETVRDRVRALVEKRRVERRFEVIGGGEGGSL